MGKSLSPAEDAYYTAREQLVKRFRAVEADVNARFPERVNWSHVASLHAAIEYLELAHRCLKPPDTVAQDE